MAASRVAARAAAALVAGLALVACGEPDGAAGGEPLLAPPSQLEILVESRTLEPPPSLGGNRFVAGWRAAGRGDRSRLTADPGGARLEVVSLGGAARSLVLDFAASAAPRGAVEARFGGGAPLRVPLAARTRVPLPEALPLGRLPVELRLPPGAPPLRAALDRALPGGEARLAGDDEVEQRGASLVEVLRPLAGPALLSGEVQVDAAGEGEGRVALLQRCGDEERVLWQLRRRPWHALAAPRLRVPLACDTGWLHLRLLVAAPGDRVIWRRLALAATGGARPARAREPATDVGDAGAAAPAASSPPRRPRVVLVYVFDALRADALGAPLAGASATPGLDALAREGAHFTQHLAVAPNTLPSTKALFTGVTPRQRGGAPLGAEPPTLAEAFRAAGYRTGLFSGNVWVSPRYGMDRGFEHAPRGTLLDESAESGANDNAARVGEAAMAWLRELPLEAPVFLYLHVIHPHNPYEPPPPFRARARVEGSAIDGRTATLLSIVHRRRVATAADRQRLAALYHANLAYADARLGELVAFLRARYGRDEVLVAATSDHGEELFDHGGLLHGYTLYEEQIRIPLVLSWPGAIAPRRVERPTSTVDLHRALATLARGEWSAAGGDPLGPPAPGLEGELGLAAAASVRGGVFAARTPRWKVVWAPRTGIQWGVGEGLGRGRDAEGVFDLVADPGERRNLAGLAAGPEPRWLRARLLAWAKAEETAAEGADAPLDAETRERLRALGYVE